jgi:hypothetical protein
MKRGNFILETMVLYFLLTSTHGYSGEYTTLVVRVKDYPKMNLNYCVYDVVDMETTLVNNYYGTQEVFLARDNGDSNSKAYGYHLSWNLMWSKDKGDLAKQNLKKSNKKLKIGLQYERLFLFSSSKKETFIGGEVNYLFSKNFGSYLTCLYTSKLSPNYTEALPICNVAYLGRAVLLKTGISYRIHFLYTSIGCILGRITHVWGPKKGEKYYYPLPIQLGLEASMGAEFNIWGPCSIDIGVGIQKLEIKDSIMQFYEPYSLNGVNLKVGFKVNI